MPLVNLVGEREAQQWELNWESQITQSIDRIDLANYSMSNVSDVAVSSDSTRSVSVGVRDWMLRGWADSVNVVETESEEIVFF